MLRKPVEVKMASSLEVLPEGAVTAGHLLAARIVGISCGKAVKAWSGRESSPSPSIS
jgi:hypothetical protein